MAKQKSKKPRAIVLGQTALSAASTVTPVPICDGFSVCVNGLIVADQPSYEQCELAGLILRTAERGIQFSIGDFLNYVEAALGERASQIVDYSEGWSEATCSVYRWIASRIAQETRRMDRLGIRHHLMVAALTPAKQQKWLTKAAADEEEKPWTVARLKAALEAGQDVPAESYGVFVIVSTGQAQDELMLRLEAEGLSCKAVTRHAKKIAELTDGNGEAT